MTLTVSVALCTYDGARFIDQQLRSILNQTRLPDEVVVSDDGSTDGTLAHVEDALAGSSVRLRVLAGTQPLGVTRNFERAVRACRGDLIALCDQDDVWHPDRLTVAVREFEADEALLLQHADARLVDEAGRPLRVGLLEGLSVSAQERQAIAGGQAFGAYIRRNLATGATVLFRRTLLEHALPFPEEWVHDEWLAIIAAGHGPVQLLDAQLIDYRQHGSNQIGVEKPTLGYRIGRMLEPRGDRYAGLAVRATLLAERLQRTHAPRPVIALAERKASFERARAGYPAGRLARIPHVWRQFRSGEYALLSSQGILDVARDLLQPA